MRSNVCIAISYSVYLRLIMLLFVEACLVVDPCKRPPVNEIIAHLYSVAQKLNEDLNSEPVSEYSPIQIM